MADGRYIALEGCEGTGKSTHARLLATALGADPVSGRPVVAKDGRFGVYVTDGETNASIGRGDRLEEMTAERAYELLAIRREQVAEKGGAPAKRSGTRKAAPRSKTASKKADRRTAKAAPKKAAAKKAGATTTAVEKAPPRSG